VPVLSIDNGIVALFHPAFVLYFQNQAKPYHDQTLTRLGLPPETLDEFDLHKEPDYSFSPLPPEKYCALYDIEMANFEEDLPFYLKYTPTKGTALELGCGTGRLARKLARAGRRMVGIDISKPMLQKAKSHSSQNIRYLCADISQFHLRDTFNSIIIPYNTLNLLSDTGSVKDCLSCCRSLLKDQGKLLLELFIPNSTLRNSAGYKIFQFQVFENKNTTKIIKETIKSYEPENEKLILEERYRIRTQDNYRIEREDYRHSMTLQIFTEEKWQRLLHESGFNVEQKYSHYDLSKHSRDQSTRLLISATVR